MMEDDKGFEAALSARLNRMGNGGGYAEQLGMQQMPGAQMNYSQSLEDVPMNEQTIMESKLPDFVKKAMIEEPIKVQNPMVGSAPMINEEQQKTYRKLMGLDNNPSTQQFPSPSYAQKRSVNETINRTSPITSGGIDYSIIRMIIEDVVSKKLDEYLKKDSGSLATISLNPGKIVISDTKGHVFSAKLELKGNVNDK